MQAWIGAALAAAALAAALPVRAASYEEPQVLAVADVLPAEARAGDGWSVADEVRADGFACHFVLHSTRFGDFPATGDYLLAVRRDELRALATLAQISDTEAFKQALVKAGKAPVTLAKGLAENPVTTLAAIPKGIGKAASKAAGWLRGDRRERAKTENSATREAIGWSRRKRELAGRLHVDPYSSNPKLQEELDRVAWASFAGGMTLTAAFAALAIPPVIEITYRISHVQATTQELVTSVSGGDLHRRNRGKLRAMGIDPQRVETFLDNPNLSPTQKTAITLALEALAGVGGRADVVEAGIAVRDEDAALRLVRAADLAAAYHQKRAPLHAVAAAGPQLLLEADSGPVVSVSAADHLLWTPDTESSVRALLEREPAAAAREMWVTGVFSDGARAALTEGGIALHERAAEDLH
jgi:hypothetical protein